MLKKKTWRTKKRRKERGTRRTDDRRAIVVLVLFSVAGRGSGSGNATDDPKEANTGRAGRRKAMLSGTRFWGCCWLG